MEEEKPFCAFLVPDCDRHISERADKKYVHYIVSNPRECWDFSHIVGKLARVNGHEVRVYGVERNSHCPPWYKGEKIGLVVDYDSI